MRRAWMILAVLILAVLPAWTVSADGGPVAIPGRFLMRDTQANREAIQQNANADEDAGIMGRWGIVEDEQYFHG